MQIAERQHSQPERAHRVGQRRADLGRLGLDVGVEQRLADDRRASTRSSPARRRRVAPSDHDRRVRRRTPPSCRVGGDALAVKRRLHQPALSQVEIALAREQARAEQTLRALEATALGEIPVVRDQDVLDAMGIVDEEISSPPMRYEARSP